MTWLKKSFYLFLILMLGFVVVKKTVTAKNLEEKKSKSSFAQIPVTNYDGDEEEDSIPQDDEDSDTPKEKGDENSDDNSVDEYNYGDDD